MITDVRAVEHQFVPRDSKHRDSQIDALAAALEPITHGQPGEHTLITGPSGCHSDGADISAPSES